MILLKIGTLNIPKNRWLDALEKFEKIYVFCSDAEEEIKNENVIYLKINLKKFLNRACLFFIRRFNDKSWLRAVLRFMVFFLKMINLKLIKKISSLCVDYIHSSYNDFDESNLLTLLLPHKLKITRAQKETRVTENNLEYLCLKRCDRIILNDIECKYFFENKYGCNFFNDKKVLLNYDEDVRYSKLESMIKLNHKLSDIDHKIHAVILAGRVLSDKNDKRSGGRLYYIDVIKGLLEAGFVVHLHTKNILPYKDYNPYLELTEENSDFIIEKPLDFEVNAVESYGILSRYDIGILHAYIDGHAVSIFDKVNLPNRYFEYMLAHVCPIVPRGKTIVTEKVFSENKTGLIYDNLSDINLNSIKDIRYINTFFKDYISSIY